MHMIQLDDIYLRRDKVVVREIVGEILLVPISGELADMERVFSFNSVGRFVWEMLDGATSFETILGEVLEEYEVDRVTAEDDLRELIGDLLAAGLVVNDSGVTGGASR